MIDAWTGWTSFHCAEVEKLGTTKRSRSNDQHVESIRAEKKIKRCIRGQEGHFTAADREQRIGKEGMGGQLGSPLLVNSARSHRMNSGFLLSFSI